jgi:two-component system, OmpR family, phosphate regulon sensor histidine kinase PhoR
MRVTIALKLAGGYAALIIALVAGLGFYVEQEAWRLGMDVSRRDLAARATAVRAALEGKPPAQMASVARRLEQQSGARITVVAPDGRVLVDTDADAATMEHHDTRPEIVDARATGAGWALRHSSTLNTHMLYVAQSEGPGLPIIRLALPLHALDEASAAVRREMLLWALVAGLLAVAAGIWLAAGITAPLRQLTRVARRLEQGDLSGRAHLSRRDEVGDLAAALDAMAEGLAASTARLEEGAARLGSILAQMADGLIVVDPDERVRVYNPAAGRMLGAPPEQALGRPLSEVALHYDLIEFVRRAVRLRTAVRGHVTTAADQPRTLAAVVSPVEAEGRGLGAVVSLRDITEVQRLESVRRDFVANASHELRTPVASIRSLAETLEGGALKDPEAGRLFLAQIVTNTESLERLLDDMMLLARLESPQYHPAPRALDLRAALTATAARLAPQARSKHIDVTVELAEGLVAWCAEDDLMAALVNLVDNAIKYTPAGGRVELAAAAAGDRVRIDITDNGPGIPEADRKRVFERFYRVDRGRSRDLGGTGLGLSIVRHAVDSSGGEVWVEAAPEGGARFSVVLPTPAA